MERLCMSKKFNNGYAFERYVFGEPILKREAHQIQASAITFSNALRRVIANANGHLHSQHPKTEVGRDLWHFVRKFLVAAKLPIQKFGFYSAIKTDADFRYGVDGFFYLVSQDKEALAIIDAFLIPNFLIEKLENRQFSSCSQVQDELYRMKRIIRQVKQSNPNNELTWPQFWQIYNNKESAKEFVRFKNSFVFTQYDLRRPKGIKELGKEIARSLFWQIRPGVKLSF